MMNPLRHSNICRTSNTRRQWNFILVLACLTTGCGSTWSLKTVQPEIALQWPFQPNRAKVTYVRALTGVAPERTSGSVLRDILIGGEAEDRNAFVLPSAVATGTDGRIAVADIGRSCAHLYIPEQHSYLRLTGSERARISSPVA